MEKERSYCIAIQSAFTGLVTWISGRLGILFPMIVIFVAMMVIDFISGYYVYDVLFIVIVLTLDDDSKLSFKQIILYTYEYQIL